MTDFTDHFRIFIEERFASEWSAEYPSIPLRLGDAPFKQPDTGMWAEFTFMQNAAKQVSLGRRLLIRTDGFVQIDVMVRKEKNTAAARRAAEFGADVFAFQKFRGGVITATFNEKHVDKAPTAGEFERVMARVFFVYDGVVIREGVQDIA